MAKFYELFMSIMLVSLMVIGILAFVITFQVNNNSDEMITNNAILNKTYNDLITETGGFSNEAQNQQNVFDSENPVQSFGSLIFYSIVSAGKVFNRMVINVFNILINLPVKILGLDPTIVSIISAMLIVTIIIGLWIIYKIGG